ncbi:ATP-binding protein [Sorangium sp. So ce1389]|uniref:ATP-binding protein n=1 Tax=Sorangium sp. So ce1389 TaxID=3133336 RepID=UPI003F5EA32A
MQGRTIMDQASVGNVWLVGRSSRQVKKARRVLARHHDVEIFAGAGPVLDRLTRGVRPNVMAVDDRVPRRSIASVVACVRERWDQDAFPLLIISGPGSEQDLAGWLDAGVNDCLTRPFGAVELVARVTSLLRHQRLREKLARERIAEEMQESSQRFRMIANLLPHSLWMSRQDGTIEYYNSRWSDYAGGGIEHLRVGWAAVLHPEDAPRFLSRWDECRKTGEDFDIEARVRRHDGAYRWHLHRARALRFRYPAGAIYRWIGTCTDIDDLKRAEAEAAALIGGAPIGIGLLDGELRWLQVNEALAAMSGLPREALLGRRIDEVAPELEARLGPLYRGVLSSGEPLLSQEVTDGAQAGPNAARHYLVNGCPVRIGSDIIGLATLILDITERKRAERRAEEASRLKDEFLATVSHELRTPLNAILGWAAMMSSGLFSEERRGHAIKVIERNARAQTQLIEDLLDVSRITSGKLRMEATPVEPLSVVESALDVVQPAAEAKQLRLERALERGAPLTVVADPGRLQQIVWNLLSNAVKFTPEGGTVRTSLRRAGKLVEISVEDSGRGIPADFLPHVFERFRQADASATREHAGLGLGLAIVRHLVELHGGTIEARSGGGGQGATFVVRLPLAEPRPGAQGERPEGPSRKPRLTAFEEDLAGLRVLVVDDERDAREVLGSALAHCRAQVELAWGAVQGLELVRRLRPDLLLADIAMPGEDGFTLIRKIRALPPEEGGRVAAIAVTASASEEDRGRALRAGFDLHLPKPVDLPTLLTFIGRLAGRVQIEEER